MKNKIYTMGGNRYQFFILEGEKIIRVLYSLETCFELIRKLNNQEIKEEEIQKVIEEINGEK